MNTLRRLAKYSWLTAFLLVLLTGAVGMPRIPKFFLFAIFSVIFVIAFFVVGFGYVYTGEMPGDRNDTHGASGTEVIEPAEAAAEDLSSNGQRAEKYHQV